jgi:hypothetical protein
MVKNSIEIPKISKEIDNMNQESRYPKYKSFESTYFREMEYIYYNFIMKLPEIFDKVLIVSIFNYVIEMRGKIVISVILFSISIIAFSIYIIFFFTKSLIHLLSISRCILKIVPTFVINKTPELEEWIENKY